MKHTLQNLFFDYEKERKYHIGLPNKRKEYPILHYKLEPEIHIELQEWEELSFEVIDRIDSKGLGHSCIIYILTPEHAASKNIFNKRDKNWLTHLSQKHKIFIVVDGRSLKHLGTLGTRSLKDLKREMPFADCIVPFDYNNKERTPINQLFYMAETTMSNVCTNALSYAKHLISENFKSKDPTLDLGNCGLISLDEVSELFQNTHLEKLILSNEWGDRISGELKRNVSKNNFRPNLLLNISSDLAKLKNLKMLICGGNWKGYSNNERSEYIGSWYISDISPLGNLTRLEILNLANNRIATIAPIGKMLNLRMLFLNNNVIEWPVKLNRLTKLKELYLSNNKISRVSFIAETPNIRTLDLHSNKIKDLSPIRELISRIDITDSKWEHNKISIYSNPVGVPPMIVVAKGKKAVASYFAQKDAEDKISLKPYSNTDIKLVLAGNSNAGKSTYAHWLKTGIVDKDIHTTHWLERTELKLKRGAKTYNIRVFDFGGQEYYHDTHHLFFTNRTAYIVLWDRLTDQFEELTIFQKQSNGKIGKAVIENFPLEYWMDSIRYHTEKRKFSDAEKSIQKLLDKRDKEISSSIQRGEDWTKEVIQSTEKIGDVVDDTEKNILVVQNKVDTADQKKFINERAIRETYPNIYDFTSVSLYTGRGIEESRELLIDMLETLEVSNRQYLGTWQYLKAAIEREVFTAFYTLDDFLTYCNRAISTIPQLKGKSKTQVNNVLFSREDAEVFASFLADIGLCLFYPENRILKDRVYLNQDQILKNIHCVLESVGKLKGQITEEEISSAIDRKSGSTETVALIELMQHFKILFKHPNTANNIYFAPLYLRPEPPHTINIFNGLFERPSFRFRYNTFIHKSVILNFFHLYGTKVLHDQDKSDLYYVWKNGIVVKDEISGSIIMVKFIPANNDTKCAYLDIYALNNKSNEAFLGKVVDDIEELNVGLQVEKLVPVEDKDEFIPLEIILKNEQQENPIFYYNDKYYKLVWFKKYLINPTRMKKIFISYSKQDFVHVTKFLEHLSALQRDGKVSHWFCSELEAGSKWDDKIRKQMEEADIICFIISPNFMKTEYIFEHEVKRAFERYAADSSFKIVPIILDFCRWTTENNNLGDFTALPYTAKPILDFDNPNMAWYIVESCLRSMIENDDHPTGEDFYTWQKLPTDIKKLYERIVENKVDKGGK